MIQLKQFAGKKVVVLGMARTGKSAIKALLAGGAIVYAWDDYNAVPIDDVTVQDPRLYNWSEIAAMIVSPGIPKDNTHVLAAKNNSCPILSDVQLLWETEKQSKFIGITGTNGKSTVTALVNHMIKLTGKKSQVGGNIGIPVMELEPGNDYYVVELSSFQLDLCSSLNLDIALLTNIAPDHLDRYIIMENYAKSKERIFQNPKTEAIIGIDTTHSRVIYDKITNKKVPISSKTILKSGFSFISNKAYIDGQQYYGIKNNMIPDENLALIYAVANALGFPMETVSKAVATFVPLPHRCQFIRKIGNVCFVNDSKGTNASAVTAAVAKYKNIHLIAGGICKDDGLMDLDLTNIRCVYLIGDATEKFYEQLHKKVSTKKCGNLENALSSAYEDAKQDKTYDEKNILLSPACSSFDQFKNFEARGNEFIQRVNTLPELVCS